jgi:hypothetical protein
MKVKGFKCGVVDRLNFNRLFLKFQPKLKGMYDVANRFFRQYYIHSFFAFACSIVTNAKNNFICKKIQSTLSVFPMFIGFGASPKGKHCAGHKIIFCAGKILIIILLFCSCASIKKYKFVATDPAPSEREKGLLVDAYRRHFPRYLDSTVIVKEQTDSTAYNNAIAVQNQLLDEVIKAYGLIDSLMLRDTTTGVRMCLYSRADSARIVKAAFASYRPPPVFKYTEKQVPVKDDGDVAKLAAENAELARENDGLTSQRDSAIQNRKKALTNLTWLYIVAGLLLVGNVYQLFSKPKVV